MIKCLIVDDEPLAIQVIEQFIKRKSELFLAGKCRNAIEALEYLKSEKIELMFLDIEMPLVSGLQFLQYLSNPPKTILTTAYKEYAYQGFELEVVDYLLKPISFERFDKAIDKYLKLSASEQSVAEEKSIIIRDRKGMIKIDLQDILFIEGCKDYAKVITVQQSYLMLKRMKEMEGLLGEDFIRVHKSYIIPKSKIKSIQSDNVLLTSNTSIPIGASYKQSVIELFINRH